MTDNERAKAIKLLEESYAAEICRLAREEPQLERIALNAALAGDFELNAIATEALKLRRSQLK